MTRPMIDSFIADDASLPSRWDQLVDVTVVGAGMAGLVAALSLREQQLEPVVFEAASEVGGNLRYSDGVINAADPKRQLRLGIEDSPEKHLSDMVKVGNGKGNQAILEHLAYDGPNCITWLEQIGVPWQTHVVQVAQSVYPRGHVIAGLKSGERGGQRLAQTLYEQCQKRQIPVQRNHRVSRLFLKNNSVVGVEVVTLERGERVERRQTIRCRYGVILATGHFLANSLLVERYCPFLRHVPVISVPTCDGQLMIEAMNQGAQTLHRGYFVWDLLDRQINLRDPARFILVNAQGKRFCREDLRNKALLSAILSLPEKYAYWVGIDEEADKTLPLSWPDPNTRTAFEATLEQYNHHVRNGLEDELEKGKAFLEPLERELTVRLVRPQIVHALGGLSINENAQVLSRQGEPIINLYAAGDLVGGVFGEWAQKGDHLLAATVLARRSSQGVQHYITSKNFL